MECPGCRHSNPPDSKFCGECGTRLQSQHPAWRADSSPTNRFCTECGQPLPTGAPPPSESVTETVQATRLAAPESYTPKHLAEKILTSKSAIEGERKLVTVMFSDVSGFTAM